MGSSKSIFYEDCDEGVKSTILTEFKKKYSDKNITGISYWNNHNYDPKRKNEICIDIDDDRYSMIIFKSRSELIKLLEKLGRQFIIMGELSSDHNLIYFVYDSEKEKN